ncbi:UvrD-helicase domain-containing protein [Edwardsiella anguillarum]|nr:UvrD-helicase domain-containing protein [Edwardsiella anguillarum]
MVNGEQNVLVLAGAGSGKTSVLLARCAWLLQGGQVDAGQILPLAFGRRAAQEMTQRLRQTPGCAEVQARTFHGLALYIVNQTARRPVAISRLASDHEVRDAFLLAEWQRQCAEKKSQAKGGASGWRCCSTIFRSGKTFGRIPRCRRVWYLAWRTGSGAARARRQSGGDGRTGAGGPACAVSTASAPVGAAAQGVEGGAEAGGALDFPALLQQAQAQLEKGRFISPWRHILVDEFQDISPQRARLLAALRSQNSHSALFAVGDDWQAIYRFSGAQLTLTTAFHHYFGAGSAVGWTPLTGLIAASARSPMVSYSRIHTRRRRRSTPCAMAIGSRSPCCRRASWRRCSIS